MAALASAVLLPSLAAALLTAVAALCLSQQAAVTRGWAARSQ
jgi:hypothetical protein